MFADLRVPVEKALVEVLLSDGTRHSLVVFQAPGQGLESFLAQVVSSGERPPPGMRTGNGLIGTAVPGAAGRRRS